MDTHSDNLSELERRLAACTPSAAGLDADAMLFAAGRASVRPGLVRFLWPGLTAGLAAVVLVLGIWAAVERSERLVLAAQLRQLPTAPVPYPSPAPSEPPTTDEVKPSPSSVLAARPALEKGLDAWPSAPALRPEAVGPPRPDAPILRVGRSADLPDL